MTLFLSLRSGSSGPAFVGENDLDTLLWDNTAKKFYVGPSPGAGGVSSWNGRTGPVVPLTDDYSSDEIQNLSNVAGATVSDALDNLADDIGGLDTDQIDNVSGVTGTTCSDALDNLQAQIAADAAAFSGAAIAINWALNPRALVTQTSAVVFTFAPPLSREVVLIVDNQTTGLGFATFSWPANCRFSGGLPPEQQTGVSVYKLEYEASFDVYFVYVIGMAFS